VKFERDKDKAASNLKKPGVSFEEASTVFDDPVAYIFDDEDHSADERRKIIIGHSNQNRLLLTCFIERAENIIRIFSARLATKKERKDYEENVSF
jgi:hypothetical protein